MPEKQKKAYLLTHGIALIAFLGLVVYASIKFAPGITRLMSHPEDFKKFLASYGPVSALIYILIIIIHVIIVVIPGEIVQIAGGYAFGTALGTLYAFIGTFLGTLLVFFAARLLGYALVKSFISPKKLEKFESLIDSRKSKITMFVLFLIPGIPKDTLVYISGMSPVKPFTFFLICMLARFPGLLGSAYIGANLQKKNYLPVWILSGIALALFVFGMLNEKKIIDKLHRLRRSRPRR